MQVRVIEKAFYNNTIQEVGVVVELPDDVKLPRWAVRVTPAASESQEPVLPAGFTPTPGQLVGDLPQTAQDIADWEQLVPEDVRHPLTATQDNTQL